MKMEVNRQNNERIYELRQVFRGDGSIYELYVLKRNDEVIENPHPQVIGKHVYGELYFNEPSKLTDLELMKKIVIEAAKVGNMHIVNISPFRFEGSNGVDGGVSVIAIILESHIAIHTWPEENYATVDIYSCGANSDPHKAFDYIVSVLKPIAYTKNYADRSKKYKL
jgi:S-adenosylmethionine decarboxylase